jgi:predicted dehydrogenase
MLLARGGRAAAKIDRINLGVIGCGGQGQSLMRSFAALPGASITHVCDVDAARLKSAAAAVEEIAHQAPRSVEDLRRVLDDPAVHAVIIAAPDHWHAPATILACGAGKHVYVEKPCSHNLREGRLMVDAARRHNRVVQLGTQSRSAPHVLKAIELIRDGAIGRVLETRAWTNQIRGNIGHREPGDPPPGLNYDLWVGPAPLAPYRSNCAHYTWRWWYNFGTGDIGNDGAHELDIARWALGVETHPATICASGGKYFFEDDQEFPDTYNVVYEYPGDGKIGHRRRLVFELRNWCPYPLHNHGNGNAFFGTQGMMLLGKEGGWRIIGKEGKPGESMRASLDPSPHHRNFLDCIRSGARPAAEIEIGHLSTALAHLGNIAVRTGRTLRFDPATEQIRDDPQASAMLRREYRAEHWAIPRNV